MPTAAINGINLYYEEAGAGQPLVFIPGLGGNVDLWTFQTRYFKDHYRCIAIDNRGAGRSDKPQSGYSMQVFADDLNALLDHLGIAEPVLLVGASMGGLIAQAFIHDHPDRVKKLVLACTGVSGGDPHVTFCSADVMHKLANPGETAEEKVDSLLSIFYHPEFVRTHPEIRDLYLQRKFEPQPPYAYQGQLAACADPRPYYRWLAEIRVPTLVIHADEDLVWPLKNAMTLMDGMGDHGDLYIMKKAGHVFMQERPEEFNRALHDFFRK